MRLFQKIRSGNITLASLGAPKTAELLCNRCIAGALHQRGTSQKWLHHPFLFRDAQVGRITVNVVFSGFKPAVGRRAVKSSTQACKGQCRHSTCRPSCQRQRSQTAGVRRSVPKYAGKKTKSPSGRVCSCKNEKHTAQGKGSNLQSRLQLWP